MRDHPADSAFWGYEPGDLTCLDCGTTDGVEYRTTPDRADGRAWPRCEACFRKRLAQAEHNLELLSDVPPAWFDPSAAGERWSEDD